MSSIESVLTCRSQHMAASVSQASHTISHIKETKGTASYFSYSGPQGHPAIPNAIPGRLKPARRLREDRKGEKERDRWCGLCGGCSCRSSITEGTIPGENPANRKARKPRVDYALECIRCILLEAIVFGNCQGKRRANRDTLTVLVGDGAR